MALTFGKGNRSIAFNPTSAFPLDARSYFESYEQALAAAVSAAEAGSFDSVYYFGQEVVVLENNIAKLYVIQPDKTLTPIGEELNLNNKNFVKDENGIVSLVGYEEADKGAVLTKDKDGNLCWATNLITNDALQLALSLYATANETQDAINKAISAADHLKRKVVESKQALEDYIYGDEVTEDVYSYIYMVPSGLQEDDDKYDEYLVFKHEVFDEETNTTIVTKRLEKVGSWEVDLSDYVQKEEGKTLIAIDELNRLAQIPTDANANIINDVDTTEFQIVGSNLQLQINKVSHTKIDGLQDLLDKKVTVVEGKTLTSNDFTDELKAKLDSLSPTAIGNLSQQVDLLTNEIYGFVHEETGEHVDGVMDKLAAVTRTIGGLTDKTDKTNARVLALEHELYDYTPEGATEPVQGLITKVTALQQIYNSLDNTFVTHDRLSTLLGDTSQLEENNQTILGLIDDINYRLTWDDIPEITE